MIYEFAMVTYTRPTKCSHSHLTLWSMSFSTSAVVFLNASDRGVKQREGFLHMVGRDNKAIAIAL